MSEILEYRQRMRHAQAVRYLGWMARLLLFAGVGLTAWSVASLGGLEPGLLYIWVRETWSVLAWHLAGWAVLRAFAVALDQRAPQRG